MEWANGRMVLGDDMGLGKTLQAIAWCEEKKKKALVVCPSSVKYTWGSQISEHTKKSQFFIVKSAKVKIDYNVEYIICSYAMLSKFVKRTPLKAKNPPHRIYRYLYELKPEFRTLLYHGFDIIICDESHYIKEITSQRSKRVVLMAKQMSHALFMSGTPIKNRPVEFWTQLDVVDPRQFGNFWNYVHSYCDAKKGDFGWEFKGATNLDKLYHRLRTCYLRRKKQNVLSELPSKTRQTIMYDLSGEYTAEYINIISSIIDLDTRKLQLGELSKLKCTLAELMARNACAFLENMLHQTESKVLIFTAYLAPIRIIYEHFPTITVTYHGSMTDKEKNEAELEFMSNKEKRFFVATIRSAGVGLDKLKVADKVVFNDLEWSPSDCFQAEDRSWRRGQKNNVNVYYLGFKNTYHDELYAMVMKKAKILMQTLDGEVDVNDIDVFNLILTSIREKLNEKDI
jgi:SWI/SNF-related matrix-associated actin-dependent regulator 1 of chromatin subfamily A